MVLHNVLYELNFYEGQRFGRVYDIADYMAFVPNILFRMDKHDGIINGYWFMRAFFFGGLIAFSVAFLAHYASRKQNWRYLIFLLIGGAFC